MSKIERIARGWWFYFFKDKEVEKFAIDRAAICLGMEGKTRCEYYNPRIMGHCDKCKCIIRAKIRSINETCPEGKW